MTSAQTDHDTYDADEEPEYLDCERCEPTDDTEPYFYPHCCGCGADGSNEYPDCTCA